MSSIANASRGYRGYIASRPVLGSRAPQHVQNLVIRDYAQRTGLLFKLSATEYVMPGCYMILEGVLEELPTLDGIILYTLFMLPRRRERRLAIYDRILAAGAVLHTAVEGMVLRERADITRFEDIWGVHQALERAQGFGPVPRGDDGE